MFVIQNISIKHKLILITMLTCVVALLSAAAGFVVWEWTDFRRTMVQNLSTQAEMIAENCTAALAFQDAKDAEKILSVLHVKSSVVFGCVYTKDGKFFATYYRDFADTKVHPSEVMESGFSFSDGFLTVFKPIVLDGATIGTVCLRSDLRPMYAMLKSSIFIIIAVLLFASLVAYLVSTRIQRIISSPILSLADVAKVVSEKKDYSTRAVKSSNDEVGLLIDAFNEMLEQIQQREVELVDAKEKLEVRVEERTAELSMANEHLKREVAERKKAEKKLNELLNQQNALLENMPAWVFLKDTEGRYITVNHNFDLLPKSAENPVGKRDRDIFPKKLADVFETEDNQVLTKGLTIENERHVRLRNGRVVDMVISLVPVLDNLNSITGLVGIAFDITERKRAEKRQFQLLKELENANRELKEFAYVASHDLKAPLRGIKTLAEWLSADYADKLGQQGKEQMDLLLRRVERMHNLIEGVLQYSRVGRVKENLAAVNLNKLMPEIIDTLAPPANISVTVENELPTIESEPTRITQVFQNLMSNAIKYMDKPQGQIKVGCVEEDGSWKFNVTDNGPGIEEKHFEKIFQIFQTLSPRDDFESTGIGLTITKKIVELYGGRIWVESKVGEGSTFFFTLPKQKMGVKDENYETSIVS